MNESRIQQARNKAAAGLAELYRGDCSSRRAIELNGWKGDDPEYRQEFLATAHLLSDIEALSEDAELNSLMEQEVRTAAPRYAWAAVFVLACLLSLMVMWNPEGMPDVSADLYLTRVGEQKAVNLDDGSVVHLNTGTRLTVVMTNSERRITLERGEAYFAIAKDPERPLIVDVGNQSITVLGTSFNVLRSPVGVELTVQDGEVALHAIGEQANPAAPLVDERQVHGLRQVRVGAGWRLNYDLEAHAMQCTQVADVSSVASWKTGLLEFSGEPLIKVVKELNRYSAKKILVEDESLLSLKIYAVVKVGRMDLALDGLEQTLPVRVSHYFDRIVLTKK